LIDRAVAARVPAAWIAGDEVYGAAPRLRAAIRRHHLGYVMAIAANRRVPTHAGPLRVDALPALIPTYAWQRHSAGVEHTDHGCTPGPGFGCWPRTNTDAGVHHLLIRRNDTTGELAYVRYSPKPVPLRTLVAVAGQRWRVEESFRAAKGLVGLDQHQVRRWKSWYRWTTLAMLAHAFLAVATATERDTQSTPTGLITLTVNEFRRLFDALLLVTHRSLESLLACSRWRRRHQYRARLSHYKRREHQ
jgi:SRSO17 transposase